MMEFTFEKSPLSQLLDNLQPGECVSALACLEQLADLSQEAAEEALLELEEQGIRLDISDLPNCGNEGEAALRLKLEQKLAFEMGKSQSFLQQLSRGRRPFRPNSRPAPRLGRIHHFPGRHSGRRNSENGIPCHPDGYILPLCESGRIRTHAPVKPAYTYAKKESHSEALFS